MDSEFGIADLPIGDPTKCWAARSCDDPATETRLVTPTEPVRLCCEHADDWDARVEPLLERLWRQNHPITRKEA